MCLTTAHEKVHIERTNYKLTRNEWGCYHKYRHHRRSLLCTFGVIVLLHHCLDTTTGAAAAASCNAFVIIFIVKINVCLDCGTQIHSHAVEQTYLH